jgi:predicted AAA+ superfamily ATPase
MKRFVLQQLIEWKNREDRKPLILNGARQVGKTWLLHEFAKLEYKKEAYVVCRKNNLARQLFSQDFNVDRILRGLRAMTSVDIIAVAGSLLGISLHQDVSYPVGKVNVINIFPMNFEEFLVAKGEEEACKLLMSGDFETISLLHDKYTDLLRQYYYVGGMPEVVLKYVETDSLLEVRRIQSEILQGYDLDFSKHAPKEQVPRVRMVWNSIPSQLFKENKKFIYGALRKGARANDFEMAIQWLVNAGLLYKVPRCTKPELPLDIYEDLSAFKLYMVDLGLMGAMVKTDPAQVLIKNDIFKEYKGGMTEQYVLQQMKSKGVSPIYYHNTDNSRLELDFVIQRNAQMVPIEVKAEGNVRANSLTALLGKRPELHAERFSMLPYKVQGNLTNFPLYAI